jgi:diacylglycerol kinase
MRPSHSFLAHWRRKFSNALHGIRLGVEGQSSFAAHLLASLAVIMLAWLLGCTFWQWCVLGLCIALVVSLELCNSAIESLARGLCHEHNEQVGRALDIASGAVLAASIGAAAIGAAVFLSRIVALLSQG